MGWAKSIADVQRGDQIVTNGQWDRVHSVDTADDGAVIVTSDMHPHGTPYGAGSMVTVV